MGWNAATTPAVVEVTTGGDRDVAGVAAGATAAAVVMAVEAVVDDGPVIGVVEVSPVATDVVPGEVISGGH